MSQTLTTRLSPVFEATTLRGRGALEGAALVLVFTASYMLALPWLVRAWAWGLQSGIDALSLNALLTRQPIALPWGLPAVQRLGLAGPAADVGLGGWVLQAAALALGCFGVKRLALRAPPVAMVAGWVLGLYAVSLLWWGLWPQRAPQHLAEHTVDLFTFGVALQCLVPVIMGLTCFPLQAQWHLRATSVAVVLGYFVVCLPFKLLAHAWLVGHLGGAFLPALGLCFGPVLDVLLLVALCAWIASWGAQED